MSSPNRKKSTANRRDTAATKTRKSKQVTAPTRKSGRPSQSKDRRKRRSSMFASTSVPSPSSSSSSLLYSNRLVEEEEEEAANPDLLEHLYDTDTESVQEEEPEYLQRPTLTVPVDFFEDFGPVPAVEDISPDISLYAIPSMGQEDEGESLDPNTDMGRFVNPLTGDVLSSSESQPATEPELMAKTSEIVSEEISHSEMESSDMAMDLEIPRDDDDEELEKVIDAEEKALEIFLEMTPTVIHVVEEEVDWHWIAQQEETKRIQQHTLDFINDLIRKVVESSEYLNPNAVLRQNLDKRKLMLEISKKRDELQMEQRVRIFLNHKAVEFFKRRKTYRPILPDNLKHLELEMQKYKYAVERLDRLLIKESNEIEATARRQNELEIELAELTNLAQAEVQRFEEMVKSKLTKDSRPKCNELIVKLLGHMSKCRKEVSEIRFEMLIKQHAKASLMEKLSQIEDLGNGLTMTTFNALQTETIALGKKAEERNVELNKLHIRVRNDIHLMAHYKEKQKMLRNAIVAQRMALEELMDEKQVWRERIYRLKLERNRIRQQLNELSFKGGLIDKPALMFDYDRTCEKVEERRDIVNYLKETMQTLQEKLEKAEERCQRKRLSVI